MSTTTTMDHQTPSPSAPFQARALHFFKKFALRTRENVRKSRDAISPVAIPTQDFQRAHSSVDLLRKPDISPIIGFRVQVGPNPMDADDSSQDASASGNSPPLRPRRHSTWDSLHTPPIHPTFTGHRATPFFLRDQAGLGNDSLGNDSGAPLFMRSNRSLDAVVQPPRSLASNSDISPQINAAPEPSPAKEGVRNTLDDDTPQPLADILSHNVTLTTPLTDPAPSTSANPENLSRSKSVPVPEDSTAVVPKRPALLPRHSAPLPPPFCLATQRGLRLSPSIVARQPMPILNLPALPSPPLPGQDTPPNQNVPLRSIPSLSRHGRSHVDHQTDHENATLGDSDEDDGDGDEADEDEEPTDALSVHQSDEEEGLPSAGPSGIHSLKSSQKQRERDESAAEHPVSTNSPKNDRAGPNLADSVCVNITPSTTYLTMYPFSPNILDIENAGQRYVLGSELPIPGSRLEHKPSLHRVASRSMINLGQAERELRHLKSREAVMPDLASTPGHITETREESETKVVIGRLLRRTSMPNFHPTSDPPPYPMFNPRSKESRVMPTEEEGRERLPPYTNSLYLIAIMPRKMEFSSPGVQAKDRKWRRVVCELEGTTFRVYKCPPGASGAGVLGDWWEKRVGVGDVTSPNPPRRRKTEEGIERPVKLGIDEGSIRQPTTSGESTTGSGTGEARQRTESNATQSTRMSTPRPAKRISGASLLSPFRSSSSGRLETNVEETSRRGDPRELEPDTGDNRSSLSHESTGRASPAARPGSRLTFGLGQWRHGEIVKPSKSELLRAYTLQHAESGLGNDYLKRKNVIRVRTEGEQFLLQARDIPAVVEWIEGLHAGSNIALDLDERAMPRGPLFPRRRRRRMRRMEGEETRTGISN